MSPDTLGVSVDGVLFGPNDEEFTSLLANQMWTKYFKNLNSDERQSQKCKISQLFVIHLIIKSMTNFLTDASHSGQNRGTC
jgi:hypothetical protein